MRRGSAPVEEEGGNKKRRYVSRTLRSDVQRDDATTHNVAATAGTSSAGDEDTMVAHRRDVDDESDSEEADGEEVVTG